MKSTYVDPKTGDVVCPVCGARNQFTAKRTAKAKWMAVPTVGIGVLAMPKRLSCNGCGTDLKRGGSSPPPRTSAPLIGKASSPSSSADREAPPPPSGDAAWDDLVHRVGKFGLRETAGMDHRWLVRADDGATVAKFHPASGKFSVKLKEASARDRALMLDGAVEDNVQWYIDIPRSHEGEWPVLVASAVGASPEPESVAEPDHGESLASAGTIASELERLMELHAKGGLTDEEFQQAKARVLSGRDG